MDFQALLDRARSVLNPRQLSEHADAGGVGAALVTDKGNVYAGVCLDIACAMGFCAEQAAAAAMITAGESRVVKMVAVNSGGDVISPCGKCREFIRQIHPQNMDTEVLVGGNVIATIRELLPRNWT
nr:cytidine deaminase [Candidatus Sigynarchaeota archaeon]